MFQLCKSVLRMLQRILQALSISHWSATAAGWADQGLLHQHSEQRSCSLPRSSGPGTLRLSSALAAEEPQQRSASALQVLVQLCRGCQACCLVQTLWCAGQLWCLQQDLISSFKTANATPRQVKPACSTADKPDKHIGAQSGRLVRSGLSCTGQSLPHLLPHCNYSAQTTPEGERRASPTSMRSSHLYRPGRQRLGVGKLATSGQPAASLICGPRAAHHRAARSSIGVRSWSAADCRTTPSMTAQPGQLLPLACSLVKTKVSRRMLPHRRPQPRLLVCQYIGPLKNDRHQRATPTL